MSRTMLFLPSFAVVIASIASGPATPVARLNGRSEWDTQVKIAKRNFDLVREAVKRAHELLPAAITKSVNFERTKANRRRIAKCQAEESAAKSKSNDARQELNQARGEASTKFALVKRAVDALKRIDTDPSDAGVRGALMFAADIGAIEDSLNGLERLFGHVNSSKTSSDLVDELWRDAQSYAKGLPSSLSKIDETALVPESVVISCSGETVWLRVAPQGGAASGS
jgi:hypothetical protein